MSKMQRFGLIAALSAAVGVVLVVVFFSAGPNSAGDLVGTWSIEDSGDVGVRITFAAGGTFRMSVTERQSQVAEVSSGPYETQAQGSNRLLLRLLIQKVAQRLPNGQEREQEVKGVKEWLLDLANAERLNVAVLEEGKVVTRFRMRRVQE